MQPSSALENIAEEEEEEEEEVDREGLISLCRVCHPGQATCAHAHYTPLKIECTDGAGKG